MRISALHSLLAAVAYADIFDYPLTRAEIMLWRVGKRGRHMATPKILMRQGPFFILRGRTSLIRSRGHRQKWAAKKWATAHRAANALRWIPGILLIGVTGGLSMNNADKNDDVDFFCLTSKKSMWTSRFLATLILDALGMRRHPYDTHVANKICLNMFMREGAFALDPRDRDLFAAHEVLQMAPLWEKNDTYKQFLKENAWVKKFLPNAWEEKYNASGGKRQEEHHALLAFLLGLIEPLVKWLQLRYMSNHRTTEIITDGVLRFHPNDARVWVRVKLESRLRRLGVPLDKNFFHR